ncbi:MAG: contractile injection system tape measure protein [Ferruginibacter sp.]
MMVMDNVHIIQVQNIEIDFQQPEDALGLQNQIAEVFYEKLRPQMEVLFDELFGKNYYASIDKLEIDCGILNKKNWEQEFAEQAIRKLKEELLQVNKKEINFRKIEEITADGTFFFFLENGFLPWNNRIKTIADLEQLLSVNETFVSQLKKLITQQPKAAERLVCQFSNFFTAQIINEITKHRKIELDEIYLLLEKLDLSSINKHIVEAAILKAFVSDENRNSKQEFVSHLLIQVEGNAEQKSEITDILKSLKINNESDGLAKDRVEKEQPNRAGKYKQDKIKQKTKEENEKSCEAIYINNAGLVLLHPFLQTLFEHLKLTEENKWLEEFSQHKAALVLAFLATGNNEFEEFNLVLNKILCGIKIDEIIITDQSLDDEVKDECEVLLKNVIEHWSVLKNTSPDGLREAFLQRSAKLSKVDNGWLLQVEQKAIDVLLSHLPWGVGFIKLPWMNEMLFVEWA